jgi:hypothetical protein
MSTVSLKSLTKDTAANVKTRRGKEEVPERDEGTSQTAKILAQEGKEDEAEGEREDREGGEAEAEAEEEEEEEEDKLILEDTEATQRKDEDEEAKQLKAEGEIRRKHFVRVITSVLRLLRPPAVDDFDIKRTMCVLTELLQPLDVKTFLDTSATDLRFIYCAVRTYFFC